MTSFAQLTSILLLHYLRKCTSRSLAVYNNNSYWVALLPAPCTFQMVYPRPKCPSRYPLAVKFETSKFVLLTHHEVSVTAWRAKNILLKYFEFVFLQLQLVEILGKLIIIWANYKRKKNGIFMNQRVHKKWTHLVANLTDVDRIVVTFLPSVRVNVVRIFPSLPNMYTCLLYTSDAADE